jgi:hypothetical protein
LGTKRSSLFPNGSSDVDETFYAIDTSSCVDRSFERFRHFSVKLAGDADADADADVVGAGVKRRTIDVLTTVICRQCHKTFFLRL